MINPVKQGYLSSIAAVDTNKSDKKIKLDNTQKTENEKVAKIAEQIKNGEYKIDLKATASVIADSLI
ncbi:flagellar biosynthesis anti-sigma factor FlgM [Campylobacter novaezeelandiae]|uniref:flagellar biosynthesis anti-sigma factor FlgM n=1 Tax=Campylobacter novaezeelandiae TaxID=2267891 RepID=UPI001905EA40|nr:flagellar biosynthesis anti-sigma factor FlgM [Campylobacter novaezeelandiae]MBK1964358.1 flagellar biosynthesis anti-sigma factor FlgM [Campylobacter novaezeelandiae]MBK1993570.1 flagellar biosynthesis anti-sigma factor FlgM [Campylobacter novaezeelandiae]